MISVVVPAYNEEAAIGADLDTIVGAMEAADLDYEIIVVDDGSTDDTARIAASRPRVRLVRHATNQGAGAAIASGIRQARGDIIAITDADGTYPSQEIPLLVAHLDQAEMVVGARSREAGSLSWLRRPAKAFIKALASRLSGVSIADLNSGLRCFRKEVVEPFLSVLPRGHSWVSTVTLVLLANGYRVAYVPIDYYPRKGRSSFRPIADTYSYLLLVVRTIMYFDPLRVLLPISLGLLAVGGLKLLRDVVVFNWHIPGSTLMIILTGIQVGVLALLADLLVKRTSSHR
jgi:glycosyltransferase involved in cell wall biosynthesis